MNRRLLGIVATAAVFIVLFAAFAYERAQSPEALPVPDVSTTTSPIPSSSEAPASSDQPSPAQLASVSSEQVSVPNDTGSLAAKAVIPVATATLLVEGNRYALTAPAGSTLKAAMDTLVSESNFTYGYREYAGLGAFVTQINGRASDGDHYCFPFT